MTRRSPISRSSPPIDHPGSVCAATPTTRPSIRATDSRLPSGFRSNHQSNSSADQAAGRPTPRPSSATYSSRSRRPVRVDARRAHFVDVPSAALNRRRACVPATVSLTAIRSQAPESTSSNVRDGYGSTL